jgi:hypothetical protein
VVRCSQGSRSGKSWKVEQKRKNAFLQASKSFSPAFNLADKTGLEFKAWLVSGAAFGWCGGTGKQAEGLITLQLDRK